MKKFLSLFIGFACAILLSGCHKPNTIILFNKYPITKENFLQNSSEFDIGQKIYYLFITEKSLDTDMIRVRVIKRAEKAGYEAINVVYSNDFRLRKDQIFYYSDYLIMNESGYYCMMIYASNRLDMPLYKADFRIK